MSASIRALKTTAQTAVAVMSSSQFFSEVDFRLVASASALAGLLSLLTSVGGLPEVKYDAKKDQDSILKEEV